MMRILTSVELDIMGKLAIVGMLGMLAIMTSLLSVTLKLGVREDGQWPSSFHAFR